MIFGGSHTGTYGKSGSAQQRVNSKESRRGVVETIVRARLSFYKGLVNYKYVLSPV